MQIPSQHTGHPTNPADSLQNPGTAPQARAHAVRIRLDGTIVDGGADWSSDELHIANVLTAIIAASSQTHPTAPRLVRLRAGNRVLAAIPTDDQTALIGREGSEFDARTPSQAIIASLTALHGDRT